LSYIFIASEAELAQTCEQLSNEPAVAVDTEFKRETSYFPIPCLMQISARGYTVCIDLLAIKDLSPLKKILFNKNTLKIFHAARQDLELFYYMFNEVPSPIYDTQIGASFLGGDNQIGYANLVAQVLNITLDKSQTRTDWTRRPFTKKQLDYAANDVIYLFKLYQQQHQELLEKQRLSWCEQDFQRLTLIDLYEPSTELAWKKIKNYQRLSLNQKCIAYRLAKWRETIAINNNKTRNLIFKNGTLLDLAYKAPNNLDELENISELNSRTINSYGESLIAEISSALQMNKDECPSTKDYLKLTDEQSTLLNNVLQSVELKAKSNNVDPKVICSKKELEKIIRGKRDSILFEDWRYEFIGKEILSQLPNQ